MKFHKPHWRKNLYSLGIDVKTPKEHKPELILTIGLLCWVVELIISHYKKSDQ